MSRNHKFLLPLTAFVVLLALQVSAITALAQPPGPGGRRSSLPPIAIKGDTTHTLSAHFIPASTAKKTPDAKGFIQRWLVLEPIKNNRSNSTMTDSYLRTTFASDNFSLDYNAIPKNGEMVKVAGQDLKWYALDSKTFNFNLYHFSYATNTIRNGVLFWLVTVINCAGDIKNVRLSAGANSAGLFWLNGKEIISIPGDKDVIADLYTSPLVTLKKGKNIIRALVVNGQGMS